MAGAEGHEQRLEGIFPFPLHNDIDLGQKERLFREKGWMGATHDDEGIWQGVSGRSSDLEGIDEGESHHLDAHHIRFTGCDFVLQIVVSDSFSLAVKYRDLAIIDPFRIGRNIISQQIPGGVARPPDQDGAIKALLIGDPTDDLSDARLEVQALADLLRADGRFSLGDENVLIGSGDCRLLRILTRLESGEYGLVHYSGHSVFEDEESAWLLEDGKINTFDLTSSLRDAPPALVFSSSCESAEAGQPRAIKYEDQTFDLPGAFLQAGVQAYIGTLWEVESSAARRFVEAFYDAFLTQGQGLGESMRRAKMASKAQRDRINWLAFTLYGDPGASLADLFPGLGGET